MLARSQLTGKNCNHNAAQYHVLRHLFTYLFLQTYTHILVCMDMYIYLYIYTHIAL